MPLVTCTHCRGEVALPDAWIDPSFLCPHCAATVAVPTAESSSLDFEAGPRRRTDRVKRRTASAPTPLTSRSLFVAVLAAVFLGGLALVIAIRAYSRWNGF